MQPGPERRRQAVRRHLAAAAIFLSLLTGPLPAGADEANSSEPEAASGAIRKKPRSLRGLILDADGRPLAGASIAYRKSAGLEARGWLAPRPTLSRTDEEGKFDSGETIENWFDLRVLAEGHALRTLRKIDPREPLTVTLERGHAVVGRVLARTTGEGIAGIRVALDDSEPFEFDELALESTTDEGGRYRFAHAPEGEIRVRATGNGWARRSVGGNVRSSSADDPPIALDDLWLPEGGDLAGRVVDDRGQGVADVRLFVAALDYLGGGRESEFPVLWGWGDETGHYEFKGVTAGAQYRVTASHDSYSPAVAGPIFIDAGANVTDVDLTLSEGATLRFRLVDAEDRPCTQVELRLDSEVDVRLDAPFGGTSASTENGGILSGEEGWLTVHGLSPGRYSLRLAPRGWADLRRSHVTLIAGETTDLGMLDLEAGSWLRGRILDRDETPVTGATVTVHWQNLSERFERRATSDSAGRFAVGGLPQHSLKLEAVAHGFAVTELDAVRAGRDEVVVTLERRGGIRGTVKLAEGGAPASFSVGVYAERIALKPPPTVDHSNGAYEIRDLNPGLYELQVRVPGRMTGRLEKVRVRPGETTDAGGLVLEPGLRVDGRVVAAEGGVPLAGVKVRVDLGAGPPRWSEETGQLTAISDANGRFGFDELGAGRYTLSLFHPDFAPARRNLDLDATVHRSEIEIGLNAGGEISGVVVDAHGLPVAGANLFAYRGVGGFDQRQTTTGKDGSYRIPRLAEGTYILMLQYQGTGSVARREVKTVELREGQTKELKLTVGKN